MTGPGAPGGSPGIWEDIRQRIAELDAELAEERAGEDLAEVWHRRALDLARSSGRERDRGELLKTIVCKLGAERYGIPIGSVREIQRVGDITPVSTAPPFVLGVTNLRGAILTVVDLRVFLGLQHMPLTEQARILVAEGGGMGVGLVVERVEEIADLPAAELKPPLSPHKGLAEDYIAGIAALRGQMVVMVEIEKVLSNPRMIVDEAV